MSKDAVHCMTPKEKCEELLDEFEKEKAIDVADTMYLAAKGLGMREEAYFWQKVLKLIKQS